VTGPQNKIFIKNQLTLLRTAQCTVNGAVSLETGVFPPADFASPLEETLLNRQTRVPDFWLKTRNPPPTVSIKSYLLYF
jgi:hypothetical protein